MIPDGTTHYKIIEGVTQFFKKSDMSSHRQETLYHLWNDTEWEKIPIEINMSKGHREPKLIIFFDKEFVHASR
jgi:hypothetical protein